MAIIRPFNALRPQAERAPQVAAVPYDVVNTDEARALVSGNPWSFLHVSRPEIDLAAGTPIYSDVVYTKAGDNFARLIEECPLVVEETPSLYLYRLIMGDHEQIGVVACCSVDEYDRDIIRKHERTRRDKEDDRTRHIMVLRAQTGPVFLTYRATPQIDSLVANALRGNPPLYDFVANDDIRHTIWRVPNYDPLVAAFKDVPYLYIADGHHRAASASRARAELKETAFAFIGNEEYEENKNQVFVIFVLMVVNDSINHHPPTNPSTVSSLVHSVSPLPPLRCRALALLRSGSVPRNGVVIVFPGRSVRGC